MQGKIYLLNTTDSHSVDHYRLVKDLVQIILKYSVIKIRHYLEGVMGVKSSPMVLMTLRPQTHRPMEIPAPPITSIQMGTSTFGKTMPYLKMTQSEISGPMALLKVPNIKRQFVSNSNLMQL